MVARIYERKSVVFCINEPVIELFFVFTNSFQEPVHVH